MFAIDRLILIGAVLVLIGIASSRFSSRLGLPVLVLFLAVGMLAGSEGIGGIEFENYTIAHGVGTLALAIILFDGGLRTSHRVLRTAAVPSVVLATAGVLLTAGITGLAASLLLGLSPIHGLLVGSIVASTDAAAVFSVLRARSLNLVERVAATLEVESGSNDPMAIFLTVACLTLLTGGVEPGVGLLGWFVWQMVVGGAVGAGAGWGAGLVLRRVDLPAAGLYPVLAGASGLFAYGLAAAMGGSGFLSVYVAGIVLGNSGISFQRGVFLFHDGLAWLAQIVMFVLLGLLSFPSRLAAVAPAGLLIAAALTLIARPLAVALCLLPFGYRARELVFISWVGLKGAVPVILATYPLLFGLVEGGLIFDSVFFVVLVSAVTQGWTVPQLARRLGLQRPAEPEPPVTLEISSVRHVQGDIIEYQVTSGSRAANRALRELPFVEQVVVAMVAREGRLIPPRGSTILLPGDYVFVFMHPEVRPLVDRIFSEGAEPLEEIPRAVEFPLAGTTTVGNLEEFYGIRVDADPETTLDELMRSRLPGGVRPGASLVLGEVAITARTVVGGRVKAAGLTVLVDRTAGVPAAEVAPESGGEHGATGPRASGPGAGELSP